MRTLFERWTRFVQKMVYLQSKTDHTMFYKHSEWSMITIVYVDYIIVTRNNVVEIGRLKRSLAKEFDIKDLRWDIFLV